MDASALFGRALALEDAGRADEALETYRALLAQAPGHEDAWHNQGLLLARLGRLREAEHSHRQYIHAFPDSARARSDLADVLLACSEYEAAIEALEHVLRAHPHEPAAIVRKGVALSCLRQFADAREVFSFARTRSPREVRAFLHHVAPRGDLEALLSPENIFISRAYSALGQCDWSSWDALVTEMRRAASEPQAVLEPAAAFMAQHLPLSGSERLAIARGIAARIEAAAQPMPAPHKRRPGRIRVGVLSPDFREHLNAYLLLPLFELLPRERIEPYAYSLAPDDGSTIRARVRASAAAFRELHFLSDRDAARAIRRDDIDILLDVAGHTTGGRFAITAQRPARVQVLYLGFSGSLGSRRVDYVIADPTVAADPAEWSEERLMLPDTWFLYDFRPRAAAPPVTRRAYGLPDDAMVYCAFHRAEKISPDSFALWMRVVREVPGSVLWFLALPPAAVTALRTEASKYGVDPERLVFAPFESTSSGRYPARQRLGDLMLDALHHNAMTTACDALGQGLPVLTLRGSTITSRAGESLLKAAHLPELITASPEDFVRLAVALGRDRGRLAGLKAKLAQNRDTAPLFDTARRVRELQACFERMVSSLPTA
jgi:predicted O-linked N-acetylglucosamine transferase (SPINDLY family)